MATLYGYRDLAFLKSSLLPADMGDESDYDADLQRIGAGVADAFDRMTGRLLRRMVGARYECAANVASVVITSYPVEAVTKISIAHFGIETEISNSLRGMVKKAGILHFPSVMGGSDETLIIESSGGYWCDNGLAMPAGATPLPGDLLSAWIHQCRAVCEAEDIFRQKAAGKGDNKGGLDIAGLKLADGVRETLNRYMRIP